MVFERFTERARQVVVLAQDEARGLNHGYIGTEHLLLGLIREEEGAAARALESLRIDLDWARREVLGIVGQGDHEFVDGAPIPFTPRMQRILELANEESKALGHPYVDTEHLLLATLRDGEGVAAHVIVFKAGDSERARAAVFEQLRIAEPPGYEDSFDVGRPVIGWLGLESPPRRWVLPAAAAGGLAFGVLIGWLIWG
jgi:ATP-dependent Clp protease ATP-binding subunit ClpC